MDTKTHHFFTKTEDAWEAMLAACKEARVSIDLEQYIFTNDDVGRQFIEIFIQKIKEGVKVRLICDTVGSYYFYNSSIPQTLRAAGIEIRFFNIISPWRIHNCFSWYFRDHRKILIVDGKTAFVGGVGIRESMRSWRDTNVMVTGRIIEEIQKTFNEMWILVAEKNIFARIRRSRQQHKKINFVTNSPYPRRRFLYHQFIEAIRSSKKYVYLTTPYFVPNQKLLRTLTNAVRRGVDVRVVVPKTSDTVLVNRASHSFFYELLDSGVRIYQYPKDFIHAKTAIVDDTWSTIGSFNFDNLSFLYNHEANIVSMDRVFTKILKDQFLTDTEHSEEVTLNEWEKRPILWKLREFMVLPIRRFL